MLRATQQQTASLSRRSHYTTTLYEYIIRQIEPKKVWDTVNDEVEFIEGGFPIATFFVDVAPDAYCVDDSDCRLVFHFLFYCRMVGDQSFYSLSGNLKRLP